MRGNRPSADLTYELQECPICRTTAFVVRDSLGFTCKQCTLAWSFDTPDYLREWFRTHAADKAAERTGGG
jgi:hypothetical protein